MSLFVTVFYAAVVRSSQGDDIEGYMLAEEEPETEILRIRSARARAAHFYIVFSKITYKKSHICIWLQTWRRRGIEVGEQQQRCPSRHAT
jgi:hypothetical protein